MSTLNLLELHGGVNCAAIMTKTSEMVLDLQLCMGIAVYSILQCNIESLKPSIIKVESLVYTALVLEALTGQNRDKFDIKAEITERTLTLSIQVNIPVMS